MLTSEWEVEEKECYIDVPWDEKEYYISHKNLCKNCKRYSPCGFPYLFCPHCGAFMMNGKEEIKPNGIN